MSEQAENRKDVTIRALVLIYILLLAWFLIAALLEAWPKAVGLSGTPFTQVELSLPSGTKVTVLDVRCPRPDTKPDQVRAQVPPASADAWDPCIKLYLPLGLKIAHGSITPDDRIQMIVLVLGALGALVQMTGAFGYFVGMGRFQPQWSVWYLLRPIQGGVVALGVYYLLRASLLSGINISSSTAPQGVNLYGLAGIAMLCGLFTKLVIDKLQDWLEGRLSASVGANKPKIEKVEPPAIAHGLPAAGITIAGAGFAPAQSEIRIGKLIVKPKSGDAEKLVFDLSKEETAVLGLGKQPLTIINPPPQGGASDSREITVETVSVDSVSFEQSKMLLTVTGKGLLQVKEVRVGAGGGNKREPPQNHTDTSLSVKLETTDIPAAGTKNDLVITLKSGGILPTLKY